MSTRARNILLWGVASFAVLRFAAANSSGGNSDPCYSSQYQAAVGSCPALQGVYGACKKAQPDSKGDLNGASDGVANGNYANGAGSAGSAAEKSKQSAQLNHSCVSLATSTMNACGASSAAMSFLVNVQSSCQRNENIANNQANNLSQAQMAALMTQNPVGGSSGDSTAGLGTMLAAGLPLASMLMNQEASTPSFSMPTEPTVPVDNVAAMNDFSDSSYSFSSTSVVPNVNMKSVLASSGSSASAPPAPALAGPVSAQQFSQASSATSAVAPFVAAADSGVPATPTTTDAASSTPDPTQGTAVKQKLTAADPNGAQLKANMKTGAGVDTGAVDPNDAMPKLPDLSSIKKPEMPSLAGNNPASAGGKNGERGLASTTQLPALDVNGMPTKAGKGSRAVTTFHTPNGINVADARVRADSSPRNSGDSSSKGLGGKASLLTILLLGAAYAGKKFLSA